MSDLTYRHKRALWAALMCPDDDEQAITAMMTELDRTPATYPRTEEELRAEAEALLAEERDTMPLILPPSPESAGERLIVELRAAS